MINRIFSLPNNFNNIQSNFHQILLNIATQITKNEDEEYSKSYLFAQHFLRTKTIQEVQTIYKILFLILHKFKQQIKTIRKSVLTNRLTCVKFRKN